MERLYCCCIRMGGSATCRASLAQGQEPPHEVFQLEGKDQASVPGHWQRQNRQWTHGSVSAAHCMLPDLALLLGARKTGVRPDF